MRPDHVGLGGFDSHPLPPRAVLVSRVASIALAVLAMCASAPRPVAGQVADSATLAARARIARDTMPLRVTPRGAFLRSLLVPGWGQAKLDRGTAGAAFVITETLAAVMIVKTKLSLDRAKDARGDSIFVGYELDGNGNPVLDQNGQPVLEFEPDPLGARTKSRRQQLEDWIAILAFNHLFSGADAFVAGHLGDIPRRLTLRPTADGLALSARVHW